MFSRLFLLVPLAILCIVNSVQSAHGFGMDACTIYVNGNEAFLGIMGSNAAPHEALRAIGSVDIRPSPNSPYMLNGERGVDLVGDIELAVSGQPSMRMQSLRIVYAPAQTAPFGYEQVSPRWKIHRDDAAKIKAFYKFAADHMRDQQVGITFQGLNAYIVLVSVAAILLTFAFLLFYVLCQDNHIITATTSVPSDKAKSKNLARRISRCSVND